MAAEQSRYPGTTPRLRIVSDEDAPTYDAESHTAPKRESVVMARAESGETILGTLGVSAFGVYWHLCKRSNKDGQCWPSLDDIAEATMLSRMHVTRMLNALEKDGWVTRTKRSNRHGMATSTLYTIVVKDSTDGCNTIPTKDRTDGCNTPVTSREHDGTVDVTRTSNKLVPNYNDRENPLPPKTRTKRTPDYGGDFEVFWKAYLSHDKNSRSKKPDTEKLWSKLSEAERADAIAAIPLFAAGRDWRDVYIPGAQVWLRSRKWENPPEPAKPNGTGPHLPPGIELPPGVTFPIFEQWIAYRKAGLQMPEERNVLVDRYLAALNGAVRT